MKKVFFVAFLLIGGLGHKVMGGREALLNVENRLTSSVTSLPVIYEPGFHIICHDKIRLLFLSENYVWKVIAETERPGSIKMCSRNAVKVTYPDGKSETLELSLDLLAGLRSLQKIPT